MGIFLILTFFFEDWRSEDLRKSNTCTAPYLMTSNSNSAQPQTKPFTSRLVSLLNTSTLPGPAFATELEWSDHFICAVTLRPREHFVFNFYEWRLIFKNSETTKLVVETWESQQTYQRHACQDEVQRGDRRQSGGQDCGGVHIGSAEAIESGYQLYRLDVVFAVQCEPSRHRGGVD